MMWMKKFLGLQKFEYNQVVIPGKLLDKIIALAVNAYPQEALAFFEGQAKRKTLLLSDIIHQQYRSSKSAAHINFALPLTHNIVGSLHSHPTLSNRPSSADVKFFQKHFGAHAIICKPFSEDTLAMYNKHGQSLKFTVK